MEVGLGICKSQMFFRNTYQVVSVLWLVHSPVALLEEEETGRRDHMFLYMRRCLICDVSHQTTVWKMGGWFIGL